MLSEVAMKKYDNLHRQLDRIGCEMGSRGGRGVEWKIEGLGDSLEEMKNKT